MPLREALLINTPDALIARVEHRLSDPTRWHGKADTREGDFGSGGGLDARGRQVPAVSDQAVRHCLIGALKREALVPEGVWPLSGNAGIAYARIARAAGWRETECHNDDDGYEVVIDAVRRARDDGTVLLP